ncbi:MAG: 4Fe-4S binding protein [Thermoplasmata archaeon]|nr:MAG: 4Fe-4S binding protein [Thermoplasmata archaeon]
MVKRQIIKIDEDTCTGCGDCIPNCPEGALQIIDDKARIISDLFCDGLGACIGHCPVDAISIEEREAEEYDEKKVMANVVKEGPNVIEAHLVHLKEHGQTEYLNQAIDYLKENIMEVPQLGEEPKEEPAPSQGGVHGCPGSAVMDLREEKKEDTLPCGCLGSAVMDLRKEEEECVEEVTKVVPKGVSQLRQWPVQIMLVPPNAPYFKDADLLIAADCVPFAYPDFHNGFLKDKILLVGCPKLDDYAFYREKIAQILKVNNIKSITVAHMEVLCCFGLVKLIQDAIGDSGKDIPVKDYTIGVKGDILEG